jgi:hypothetical protein
VEWLEPEGTDSGSLESEHKVVNYRSKTERSSHFYSVSSQSRRNHWNPVAGKNAK